MDDDLQIHKGVVDRWVRSPDAKGFGILTLDRRPIPLMGTLSKLIKPGDSVAFLARLKTHPRYGEQLQVSKMVMHLPGEWNVAGWLAQRLPHIGPVRGLQIQERFGDKIWNVIEDEPERLMEIDGITAERARQIASVYETERKTIEVYMYLMKLGVDSKVMLVLVRKDIEADELLYCIDHDPYQLLKHDGITFAHCDAIGDRIKMPKDDPRRICGFVVHLLREARSEGHTVLPMNKVSMDVRTTLRVSQDALIAAVNDPKVCASFVFFGKYMQWRALADHEAAIHKVLMRRRGEVSVC